MEKKKKMKENNSRGPRDTMRCDTLKTINLQWRIIEQPYAWHRDFILTTTNSEGIFQ